MASEAFKATTVTQSGSGASWVADTTFAADLASNDGSRASIPQQVAPGYSKVLTLTNFVRVSDNKPIAECITSDLATLNELYFQLYSECLAGDVGDIARYESGIVQLHTGNRDVAGNPSNASTYDLSTAGLSNILLYKGTDWNNDSNITAALLRGGLKCSIAVQLVVLEAGIEVYADMYRLNIDYTNPTAPTTFRNRSGARRNRSWR